jgi:hypothetical protein
MPRGAAAVKICCSSFLMTIPDTSGDCDGRPLQQVEGPVLLHVVIKLQMPRHRHFLRLGSKNRLLRHEECVERGVRSHKLSLENAKNSNFKVVLFLKGNTLRTDNDFEDIILTTEVTLYQDHQRTARYNHYNCSLPGNTDRDAHSLYPSRFARTSHAACNCAKTKAMSKLIAVCEI